jgi:hypothetical protein
VRVNPRNAGDGIDFNQRTMDVFDLHNAAAKIRPRGKPRCRAWKRLSVARTVDAATPIRRAISRVPSGSLCRRDDVGHSGTPEGAVTVSFAAVSGHLSG